MRMVGFVWACINTQIDTLRTSTVFTPASSSVLLTVVVYGHLGPVSCRAGTGVGELMGHP